MKNIFDDFDLDIQKIRFDVSPNGNDPGEGGWVPPTLSATCPNRYSCTCAWGCTWTGNAVCQALGGC